MLCQAILLLGNGLSLRDNAALIDDKLDKTTKLTPCVQALLNEMPLHNGKTVSIKSKGTVTVETTSADKILFNLILKTNPVKKSEPPIYLRFIKVDQLDIRKVLDYARVGDEIYIEQYLPSKEDVLRCSPSSFLIT
jgi:hypothetical protein